MLFRRSSVLSKLYGYIKSSRSVCPYVNLKTTLRISDIDCGCFIYPTWICRCNRKYSRSSSPEVFCNKSVLRNFEKFAWKHPCQNPFFNKVAGAACNFIKKETLAQVFSCEFCELFKNIEHLCSFWYSFFIMLFLFVCSFFLFVIIFSDWFLLGKSYFNATTLSKVTNN